MKPEPLYVSREKEEKVEEYNAVEMVPGDESSKQDEEESKTKTDAPAKQNEANFSDSKSLQCDSEEDEAKKKAEEKKLVKSKKGTLTEA